ncbi:hypothetical protein KSS87_008655 [Heliosperma pusillum]|nr:hypothetical protein KSS87_008655 [Heliosperma pusillum]
MLGRGVQYSLDGLGGAARLVVNRLQQVLDSFIIFAGRETGTGGSFEDAEVTPSNTFSPLRIPSMEFIPSNIRLVPFPTRAYTDDEFQYIVKKVMGVLYLLGFLYPISRLISCSVFEKEQKIKEGLYMMGLKSEIFHISWFITYAVQFAVSSAIITVFTMCSLFKYSDKSLVFTYFFSFGLSAITLSFMISTFFMRAKTAVAVGTLSFFGAFFPYYMVNDPDVSMALKATASLLSPTAFALGSINFADYERAHVGLRWSNIWRESSGVNFLVCLSMMIFDTVLYFAIGVCLDKFFPKEDHTHFSWRSMLPKCLGRIKDTIRPCISSSGIKSEAISLEMKQQEIDCRCLQIRNLSKVYSTKKGDCCAVDSLHLNLYENQILALLGHNGAGKSTTISMLVGLIPPTAGDALIFGRNILSDMNDIRKDLGVCPQSDILFSELTVKEHLEIYGILKCVKEDVLDSAVAEMIDEVQSVDLELVCPRARRRSFTTQVASGREQEIKNKRKWHQELKVDKLKIMGDESMQEASVWEDEELCFLAVTKRSVGLADKINTVVSALSGGMKRKLSLGIALIGNSKVIILDEPTSGMDPYSMRLTWQLIKKVKKGRIVLLTTHSMDEAEVLGDRIAIMANGSLKCCGSSLYLKHQYGVGYTLTLVKTAAGASLAADIVNRHIPSATVLSEVGTEISFKLPLASSSCFEGMFHEIESCMKKSASCSDAGVFENECAGIESFGISVTTLEEVFLRVAGSEFDETEGVEQKTTVTGSVISQTSEYHVPKKCTFAKFCESLKEFIMFLCLIVARTCGLFFASIFCLINSLNMRFCCASVITNSDFWQHSKALLKKRAISAQRDQKTIVFQLVIPAVFLLFGLLFLKLKPHPDQQSITFTTSNFNPLIQGGGGAPIPFDLSFPIAKEIASHIDGGWIQEFKPSPYRFPDSEKALSDAIKAAGPSLGPKLLSMSEFLMYSLNQSYQSRYGAIMMDDENDDGSLSYTVLHNSSCQHAAPTYINLINSAILKFSASNDNMTIQTRNHALPLTKSQHLQRHDLDAFSAAIIVTIAFSFIPASFAVPIVKEREVKAKHQQLLSGVSILSYWVSTYLWDFISFLIPSSFAIALFYIFGLDQFVGTGCLCATIMLFLEFGLAVASSTYCLTFFFSDHSLAQNVILLVHFFTGLILMVISFIMDVVETTAVANSYLKNVFRLSPGFCFADGLASLALLRQGMKDKSSHGVLDWNVTGASICYLAVESIFYFLLALGLEVVPPHKLFLHVIYCCWERIKGFCSGNASDIVKPLLSLSPDAVSLDLDEDVDVAAERNRVLSGAADRAILYLRNLRKVYPGREQIPKVAVQSLTFAVHEGECFGFLGTNGAGKTTTLSMISGEQYPSEGTAFIFGKDILSDTRAARRHIGYCPQFDALLENLTVKEHLELYARIKRVPNNIIEEVVMEKIVAFDLLRHANKPSFSLSGGNKRKLSVAIAMIGDPPILILDEPSTGMDPLAKRFMWDVISRLSTRRGRTAVILTTHSMNEAQALCTRMGIMVGGRLRCIGSPQHLKTRFGNHLELEVTVFSIAYLIPTRDHYAVLDHGGVRERPFDSDYCIFNQVKPTEVSSQHLETLSVMIQEKLCEIPSHPKSLLSDLETCIGGTDITPDSASVAEISLSRDSIIMIARWLGDEERVMALINSKAASDAILSEQLFDQLLRDGGIPLLVFTEWWLTKQKFSVIDCFILSSFPGATFQGCNGLSVRYQLPFREDLSLADAFGHIERNKTQIGIAEYSISQSTLESIFNHFAATS